MQRRDFLKASGTATSALLARAWTANAEATGDWPEDLALHRIEKIEAWRSVDRYARSLGPNSKGGPKGRGYGRQFRTVTTDRGAVGIGMSWAPADQVDGLLGAKVGDLFDALPKLPTSRVPIYKDNLDEVTGFVLKVDLRVRIWQSVLHPPDR